jgi:hypothetical protein
MRSSESPQKRMARIQRRIDRCAGLLAKPCLSFLLIIPAVVWFGFSAVPAAAAVERTIVYIECTLGNQTARGTGVIVSPRGHVLTARHVTLGPGSNCKGSIGVADSGSARLMVQQPTSAPVDAALLRFADAQQYEFMSFCTLEDWMVRRKIFVAGFPSGTETGAPSFREGVLSTVFPNANGVIETDGQTIAGMSGGPVFSKNLAGIVGIVIGAKFSAGGTVSYFGILPVSDYASMFNLVPSATPCYHPSTEIGVFEWKTEDQEVDLKVRPEEGFCFLSSVRGIFNDSQDTVSIDIRDGRYVLDGVDDSGGQIRATARCIWYD